MPTIYKPEENPILKFYNNKIGLTSDFMQLWQGTQNTDYGYYINEYNSSGNIKIGTTGGSGSQGDFSYGYLEMTDNGQFSLLGSPNYKNATASSQNVIFNPLVLDKETIITRIGNRAGATEVAGDFDVNNAYPMTDNIVKDLSNTEIIDLIRNDENIILNLDGTNDIGTFYNNETTPRTALTNSQTSYVPLVEYEVTNVHANGINLIFPTGGGLSFYFNPFQKLRSCGGYSIYNAYSSQTTNVNTGSGGRQIRGWNEKNNNYKVNTRSIYPLASGAITENLNFNDFTPVVIKHTSSSSRDSFKFVVVKKSSFEYLLNLLAIPWTYDTTKAINNPIEDFNDGYDPAPQLPIEPGQPDNTTDEWGNDGDNVNDPFDLKAPTVNPFYSTCKQYIMSSKTASDFVINQLYNGNFLQNLDLAFNNPKEGFISLQMYPFDLIIHDGDNVGTAESIICGKVKTTDVAPVLNENYNCIVDIGEYDLKPYFNSFLDIAQTQIDLFVPYIGWVSLDTSNFYNRKMHVKYVVDFTTGNCSVFITSVGEDGIERLEKIANGVMGVEVPVISSNYNEKLKSTASTVVSTAISALAAYATGGSSVAIGAGVASSAAGIAGQQNHVAKGGAWGGILSLWQPQQLILQITRPEKSEATEFKNIVGYRSNYSTKLNDVDGFVVVSKPLLNNIDCTENERAQIKALLQGGIYL